MSRKRSSSALVIKRPLVDDLTLIHGIGPINQRRLQDSGISTFERLAASNAEEIAALIPNLSAQQILKQGWIRQASKLTKNKLSSRRQNKKSNPHTSRQHYQNFTLEFLLDEQSEVCRLRVLHVQSGDINTWPDWNVEQLIGFFAHHTMARPLLENESLSLVQPNPKKQLLKKHAESVLPLILSLEDTSVGQNTTAVPVSLETKHQTPPPVNLPKTEPKIDQSAFLQVKTNLSEKIRLLEWETLQNHSGHLSEEIIHDQVFTVRLTLDLAKVLPPEVSQLQFKITMLANKILGKSSHIIAETDITKPFASIVNLIIRNVSLPVGFYRLEAIINLKPIGIQVKDHPTVTASFESAPLFVH